MERGGGKGRFRDSEGGGKGKGYGSYDRGGYGGDRGGYGRDDSYGSRDDRGRDGGFGAGRGGGKGYGGDRGGPGFGRDAADDAQSVGARTTGVGRISAVREGFGFIDPDDLAMPRQYFHFSVRARPRSNARPPSAHPLRQRARRHVKRCVSSAACDARTSATSTR